MFLCDHNSVSVYGSINDLSIGRDGGRATAVIIQEMVFGNLNFRSCTGKKEGGKDISLSGGISALPIRVIS